MGMAPRLSFDGFGFGFGFVDATNNIHHCPTTYIMSSYAIAFAYK